MPSPFSWRNDMQAALNGVNFRPSEIRDIVKALNPGDELTLERDAENAYDSNAIKVLSEEGAFLGFVEKDVAAELAPKLDAGETFTVTVDSFQSTIKPILNIE